MCLRTNTPYTRIVAMRHLATLLGMQSRLDESRTYYERVIAEFAELIPAEVALSAPFIGLGEIWYEWNDLDKAKEYLRTGLEYAAPLREWNMLMEGNMTLLQIARVRKATRWK